jgi:enoyl-CoA hydratase/carnithine racemase
MSDIRLRIADGIATVTLDRADKLNALTAQMIRDLGAAADEVDGTAGVRVAILTGAGERAFCAGGDIAAWSGLTPMEMGQRWVREGHRVFDQWARLKVPVIAVLNGPALGGGFELAGVADLRIAEEHCTVAMPETSLGMVPGWSGTQRLVRRFGPGPIRRMVLLGDRYDAEGALALGLVDEVVGRGEGLSRAFAIAAQVKARGPQAIVIAKQLINAAEGEDQAATLEILAGALVSTTAELAEGVASFREKRRPSFGG